MAEKAALITGGSSGIGLAIARALGEDGYGLTLSARRAEKLEAAIRGGVRRVHVISYSAPEALLAEIFTNEGTGTLVVADTKALSPAEQSTGGA